MSACVCPAPPSAAGILTFFNPMSFVVVDSSQTCFIFSAVAPASCAVRSLLIIESYHPGQILPHAGDSVLIFN